MQDLLILLIRTLRLLSPIIKISIIVIIDMILVALELILLFRRVGPLSVGVIKIKIKYHDRLLMSTNASILVDSVGPPSAEVCRTSANFP